MIIGTFTGPPRYEDGPVGGGSASANEYSTIQELLYKLPDNDANLIQAKDVRDSVYTLWEKISDVASQSATVSVTYTNLTPTYAGFGGITAGSTFSNESMQTMWSSLLYPYVGPTDSLAIVGDDTREFGASNTLTLNWVVIKGTELITTIIVDGTPVTATGGNQSGSKSATATQNVDTTFSMSVSDGITTVTATDTLYWSSAVYWGKTSTFALPSMAIVVTKPAWADGAGVACSGNYGKLVTTTLPGVYDGINGSGQYLVFAWPSSYGWPKFTINGLQSTAFTKIGDAVSHTNMNGYTVDYDVWISNSPQNLPISSFIITAGTDDTSKNAGTLVTSAIRPNSPLDEIATAYSNEIMGGLHTATASTDRDAIIEARREWGMLCYVIDDNKTYQLSYGYSSTTITDDNNWVEFSGSGGGGEWLDSVITVRTDEPLSNTDGDRYLVGTDPSDVVTGANWSLEPGPGFVAQWSSAISNWNYTTPLEGMSVRADDEDSTIYRYEGTYSSGSWLKEKENQVRYITATTSNGASYSGVSVPYFNSYDSESIYIFKFQSTNTGASASININGIGDKLMMKTDGLSLSNITSSELTTSYQYIATYNGTYFELQYISSSSGLSNKYYIADGQTVVVPENTQYWIYGDLGIDGSLDNYGEVVVANGSLQILGSGSFNNYSTYSNIYFAEIDGLGFINYIPRWKTSYMLTGSSSIYDDGDQVTIDSTTFSVSGDLIFSSGATDGYVLTSDTNGVATWQLPIRKYSATSSFDAHGTQSFVHSLNSDDIIFTFWNEDTQTNDTVDVVKVSTNEVVVCSATAVSIGRIVIMS